MENLNINTYHTTDEINPEVWDVLLLRRKLDLLLRTGKLLMESAAVSYPKKVDLFNK